MIEQYSEDEQNEFHENIGLDPQIERAKKANRYLFLAGLRIASSLLQGSLVAVNHPAEILETLEEASDGIGIGMMGLSERSETKKYKEITEKMFQKLAAGAIGFSAIDVAYSINSEKSTPWQHLEGFSLHSKEDLALLGAVVLSSVFMKMSLSGKKAEDGTPDKFIYRDGIRDLFIPGSILTETIAASYFKVPQFTEWIVESVGLAIGTWNVKRLIFPNRKKTHQHNH